MRRLAIDVMTISLLLVAAVATPALGGWCDIEMWAPKSDLDHIQGVLSAPGHYVAAPGGVVITSGGANFTVTQGDVCYHMDGPYGESGDIHWTECYSQDKTQAFRIHYTEWHGNHITYKDVLNWNGSGWGSVSFTKDVPRLGCHTAMDGRFSEGQDGGGRGATGNVLNAASWNASALGTQWTLSGLTLQDVSVLSDTVVGGNGQVVYETDYDSGTLTMKVGGPWGDSSALAGNLTAEVAGAVTSTHTYAGGSLVGIVSDVRLLGTIDYTDPRSDLGILITADVTFDGLDAGSVPAGYPTATTPLDYGSLTNIGVCIMPEPAALTLLALGGASLLVRRRR